MIDQLNRILEILKTLTSIKFYGTILIRFESGKIVCVKKEETIKL